MNQLQKARAQKYRTSVDHWGENRLMQSRESEANPLYISPDSDHPEADRVISANDEGQAMNFEGDADV